MLKFVNTDYGHSPDPWSLRNRITIHVTKDIADDVDVLVGTYKKVCVDEETLYRRADGRLLVRVTRRCDNDRPVFITWEVEEADLWPGGRFEELGRACGITSPEE